MKHSNSANLKAVYDLIDDALKDREVCGPCLATLLLAGARECLRCMTPGQAEPFADELDQIKEIAGRGYGTH